MKKRKELNALIGLGEGKRKKPKKSSGHRLLLRGDAGDTDTESGSSSGEEDDEEEFRSLSLSPGAFRKGSAQCCSVCYPLCVFIVLAACLMACAGLIWMQIALKEDLDSLKEKLRTMESSQKASSHEIPKLSEDLKANQRTLEDIESGDKGLNKLWANLTDINRKISTLDSAVNHLKANIKSASDLITLPTTVEELQKSVATIGSTLTSVQHDVKMMQIFIEDQKKGENKQNSETSSSVLVAQDDGSRNVNEGTANDGSSTTSSSPVNYRHRRFLSKNLSKRETGATLQTLTFPGVDCAEDLEKLVRAQLEDTSEGVTYEELMKIFGASAPDSRLLEPYDVDQDHRYTLEELRAAASL
ncbi:EF-hand calcium-binding domain-containing protein 14 [Ictalurus furcatus]|uniref:EF-hand calcium-binding domain-containing protein 14 n=1 Tax=Ictalurus furcatus TaxID=66913 RepID=UPI002350E73C|nr:EF-hand calcium-binding domain-containing protein 14 [Ictalurus furcatus]